MDFTNPFPLELGTEDPHADNVTRTFTSFNQAAQENAVSRVFLGVHYPIDADDGHQLGRDVADHLTDTHLRYTQTCTNWTCLDSQPAPPAAPTNLSASCFRTSPSGTYHVSAQWNSSPNAVSYRLYRSIGTALTTLVSSGPSTHQVDQPVGSGFTYNYMVTAVNATGQESEVSSVVSVTVRPENCPFSS